MRVSVRAVAALGALLLVGCLSDPLGLRGDLVIAPINFSPDSVLLGAPGRQLAAPIRLRALDVAGHPVVGAQVQWTVTGAGAQVNEPSAWTDVEGNFSATWTLGVRASQAQQLTAEVSAGQHRATLTLTAAAIPSEVAVVSLPRDTIVVRLGATAVPRVIAADSFGNTFVPQGVMLETLDPSVATVIANGSLVGVHRGWTHLVAGSAPTRDTGLVRVIQVAESLGVNADSLSLASLGQSESLHLGVWDDLGLEIRDTQVVASIVDTIVAVLESTVPLALRSVANGRTVLRLQVGAIQRDVPVLVAQQVARVDVPADTLALSALNAVAHPQIQMFDALGNPVSGVGLHLRAEDTTVAVIVAPDSIRAAGNGVTRVWAVAAAESASLLVKVAQRAKRVALGADTIRFDALGSVESVPATAFDSLGFPVAGAPRIAAISDSGIAQVADSASVRSVGNGTTMATISVAGLTVSAPIVVSQVEQSIAIQTSNGILDAFRDSTLPITCQVLDRNGYAMPVTATVASSGAGRWIGGECNLLRLERSGFDTLRVSYGAVSAEYPVALAVRPVVSNVRPLPVDSMPSGSGPWAPTARRNSLGELEVYATGYVSDSVHGGFRGHLHRYVAHDGVNFVYDGVAVAHDDSLCALNGSGIENMVIVPRADGPGWRMFYAGGSFQCYGWQVFSAVSTDERTWTKEPGIRIDNGLPLTDPTGPVPSPAGEGMVVDQLPTGGWRMIASTYEPGPDSDDKWQITEWRSPDQLTWTYIRTVFSTRQMPPEGQRSVYSPTIREVTPGLWRMIFTADNFNLPGGRSRLWSAVSTNLVEWQLEGELLGAAGSDFLYSSLVDDVLIFMRQDTGQPRHLALANVAMP